MELIIFTFLCYGITNILVFGSIFNGVRYVLQKYNPKFLGKLITCMMCTSFWVGIFISFFIHSPILLTGTMIHNIFFYIFTGSISSGLVWLIHTIQEWFENNKSH